MNNDASLIRQILDVITQHKSQEVPMSNTPNTPAISIGSTQSEIESPRQFKDYMSDAEKRIQLAQQSNYDDDNVVDPRDVANPADGTKHFLPPLQLRIEMLKKITGVQPKNSEEDAKDGSSPELDQRQREVLAHTDGDDPTAQ